MSDVERSHLLEAFDSNWITPLGPAVDAFEASFSDFVGAPAAAALSSGTAALHLALLLAGVGQEDEVWVSDLTFVAPANAVRYVGASLRFIDSETTTWNMDPDLLDAELTAAAARGRLPRAVIVVDLYGQCAQLDRLAEACARFEVALIEDAAEAVGATWKGRAAGTWGRYGAYSFNGNKIMTTGGGGMLVGSADDMARARHLASQARLPVQHYEHDEVGFNYRMPNLLAGIGRGQLDRLPAMMARRHQIRDVYRAAVDDIEGVELMPWDGRGEPNGWLTVLQVDPAVSSPGIICDALESQEIEARPAWKPMHRQRLFADVPSIGGKVADEIFDRGVCLPSGSGLTDEDLERVVGALRRVLVGT
jgi:dTDP-4-amino-4,6-dideoxygalactose transaminase